MSALSLMAAACAPEEPPAPAKIKVTALSATVEFGDPIPDITATYSQAPAVPATCSTTATQSSPPGTYPTTCEGASDPNRAIQYMDGTITIVAAPVTVTASSGAMAIGEDPPAITATYDGLKLGQTEPTTLATCSTTATSASPAGTYPTTCSGAADDNYTFSYVDGTMQVAGGVVTVTASSGSHTYGSDAPEISPQYSGFVHGETGPATAPVCVSASNATSPVGTYASSCSGAADPSYSFVYVNGTVDVTPAPLTITASSAAMITGENAPAITPIYSGLVAGDTAPATPPTCSTTANSSSPAGTYPSSCSGAADPNYSISYVDGEVVVSQSVAPVVVTASSATITYGDPIPTVTASYAGAAGSPATPAVCSTTATAGSGVGTYETSCSGAADPAYTFTYVPGTITITAATATVTASSGSMTYGGTVPAVTASYSGLVNGDTAPATPATCSTTATSASPVGSYSTSCAGAADPNYTFNYVNGTITVDEAAVVVTASSASFNEGDAVPGITASYSGFLFGETGPAVAPVCSTNATSSSPVGTYVSTCGGASDPNYTFSYVDGVVTVNPAPMTVSTGYAGYSTETLSTTLAASMAGKSLPQANIEVTSTTGFKTYSNLTIVSASGAQPVFCKGIAASPTRFTGCEGGSGTLTAGSVVTTAAPNNFNVYTLVNGGPGVEPSSLTILQDVPQAARSMAATVSANASMGIITSLISPAAAGEVSLTFGICEAGTASYNQNDPTCHTGELVYGPGAVSVMGAVVTVSIASSNVYQRLHTFAKAPATVHQNEEFTVYSASSSTAVPKYNPSSVGDAKVNYAKDIAIVFPIPAGMEYLGATTVGGDNLSTGNVEFTYCTAFTGTVCGKAKNTGNFSWSTAPFLMVSTKSTFQINGGAVMTMPTVALRLRAVGAPGTIAKSFMTQFNLTTSINAPIIGNQTAKFEGYPTSDANPNATPPKVAPNVLGSIEIVE